MGDRVSCSLRFKQAPSQKILAMMDNLFGEPDEIDGNLFGFEEINYGNLPHDLQAELLEQKTAFIWQWAGGGGFGPGIAIGHDGGLIEFNTNDEGTIILTLDEIEDGHSLSVAQTWAVIQKEIIAGS